jgi:hypothetical protein
MARQFGSSGQKIDRAREPAEDGRGSTSQVRILRPWFRALLPLRLEAVGRPSSRFLVSLRAAQLPNSAQAPDTLGFTSGCGGFVQRLAQARS